MHCSGLARDHLGGHSSRALDQEPLDGCSVSAQLSGRSQPGCVLLVKADSIWYFRYGE